MICSNCGKEIPDNHPFCMYCGTLLKSEQAEAPAETAGEAVAETTSEAAADTEEVQEQAESMFGNNRTYSESSNTEANNDGSYEKTGVNPDGSYGYAGANPDGSYGYTGANSDGTGSYQDGTYAAQTMNADAAYGSQNGYATEALREPVKEKKSGKAPMIVFLILAIVFLAGTGVFAFLFFTQKSDMDALNNEKTALTTYVGELEGKVSELESDKASLGTDYSKVQNDLNTARNELELARSDYDSLKESYDDLQNDYDSMQDELYELYSQNGEVGSDGYNFGLIKDFYSNNVYTDFYSNKDIVVMRPGDVFSIRLKLEHDGGIVYCSWTDGNVVSHEFGNWNVYDLPFTFTAKKAGSSTYTFTNSINDESFTVLVIVTDN